MKRFNNRIRTLPLTGLAAVLLLTLAACDAAGPDLAPETDSASGAALASAYSAGKAQASSVFFNGLRHEATGAAALALDATKDRLIVSDIGPGGRGGFTTDLGTRIGVRRTFEPIDLSGEGAAASWQAYGGWIDSLPPLAFGRVRLQNRDGAVNLQADFSALTPVLTVQVWQNSLPTYTGSVISFADIIISSVKGGEGVALKGLLSSPLGLGLAAEITFTGEVSVQVGEGPPVTGNRIQFVLPTPSAVRFTQEVWHFIPSAGTSRMDVVSTDLDTFPRDA